MKWMKAGHSEASVNSLEPGPAPFGVWRGEAMATLGPVPHSKDQDIASNDSVPTPDRGLPNSAPNDWLPIPIPKEGLLG